MGAPKCGKTTFCATLAVAGAAGIAPWPGAPTLQRGRVLFLSAEQSAQRVLWTLVRVARAVSVADDRWLDHLGLLARDEWLPSEGVPLFTLADASLGLLEHVLEATADEGEPIRYVFLDSLSRLKPLGLDENSNSGVSDWLGRVAALATERAAYIVAIHHRGHSERQGAGAGRGASSFGAAPIRRSS